MPPIRPRFSLLTALLLMTIVGMAIVIVQLWREVVPLRADNHRLRNELGYLSISDENKIYAIQVAADDPFVHRFRIYLPKNKPFTLNTRLFTVPGQPIKASRKEWLASLLKSRSGGTGTIESGEHTIDVEVRQTPGQKDHWDLVCHVLGKGTDVTGAAMPQLNDRRAWSISSEASMGQQQEIDPADGIMLFTLRQGVVENTTPGGYNRTNPDGTMETPGVAVWIAPAGDHGGK